MTQQKEETFLYCRCPKCKRPFDYVPVAADECPFCKVPITRSAVWQTRRYPGTLILPGWVRAFGWPFLIILLGIASFVYPYYAYHEIELKLTAGLVSIGLVFFLFKLNTNGEV
jgi:hypothetical protein